MFYLTSKFANTKFWYLGHLGVKGDARGDEAKI